MFLFILALVPLTIGQVTVYWISIKQTNCVIQCIDSNLSGR